MRGAAPLVLAGAASVVSCAWGLNSSDYTGGAVVADAGDTGDASGRDRGPGPPDAQPESADADAAPILCVHLGDRCADGTLYAGSDPADGRPVFAAPCDLGQSPQGAFCSGNREVLPWNNGNVSGGVFVGATSTGDGAANSRALAAADADSSVAGVQPHLAARACTASAFAGANDWFLPALDQLVVLYGSQAAIGNFDRALFYWTSTETHSASEPLNAARVRFSDGYEYSDGDSKPTGNAIRCLRKGN